MHKQSLRPYWGTQGFPDVVMYLLGAPNLVHIIGQTNMCPHMGVHKSSPNWSYTAYAVPRGLGFSTRRIPSRPDQLRAFQTAATTSAQSIWSLRKPQHPSTGSPIVFDFRFELGFGWRSHHNRFFVFPTAAVDNVHTRTAIQQQYMLLNVGNFSSRSAFSIQ